ncbi:MAG: chromosome partitioning protein ParB [Magnetovibrio sp.]|nr:chromosome partitioning protein ParB [Magnetovibrio sp.]|tara:strand:- start:580 stop:1452 length:873 start_codon:yes stop_codon:yes gene_type:complete
MRDSSVKRNNLGRGLAALLGEQPSEDTTRAGLHFKNLPITDLHPCPYQPRRRFVEEHIKELAQSIREKGVLQPLVVRPDQDRSGGYEIICGERRWRAAQVAQKHEVPAVIRAFTDQEALEIALVENLQRENLTPLEEAEAYYRLKDEFGHTQEELANGIGKSRSHIANMIRLLSLPEAIKKMLGDGLLSAGHARALLAAPEPDVLADIVIAKGLSVRETEALINSGEQSEKKKPKKTGIKNADTISLEKDLSRSLGLDVKITPKKSGGVLSLTFRSLDQLDALIRQLLRS